jgi:hypothetical protein
MSRASAQRHQNPVQKHNQGVQYTLDEQERQRRIQQNQLPSVGQSLEFEDPAMTLWRWLFKGWRRPAK